MRSCLLPALVLLASCAVPRTAPPEPAPPSPSEEPAPAPVAAPAAAPALPPVHDGWIDMPPSRGDWFYVQRPPFTYAAFGAGESDFAFVMRCDRAGGTVSLGRVSQAGESRAMRILTEFTTRLLAGEPRQGGIERLIATDLAADDSLLDAMALSKGRFAVEVAGEETLYLPSWPEVTRVIEDCRQGQPRSRGIGMAGFPRPVIQPAGSRTRRR